MKSILWTVHISYFKDTIFTKKIITIIDSHLDQLTVNTRLWVQNVFTFLNVVI